MPFHLVFRNLLSHPIRAILTLLSIFLAIVLVCLLRSVVTALDAGVQAASSKRLVVQSAVSLFVDLPLNYQAKIKEVEGVTQVCKWQWFGGVYQDPSNFFAQFGVDQGTLFDLYPEFTVTAGSKEEFQADRGSCMIGEGLVKRFGWKVGQTVPLIGTIFPRTDGGVWEFRVAAVYKSDSPTVDDGTMYFHYDYLHESLEAGATTGPPGVGVYVLGLAPGVEPETVMSRVDALFENGPQRVQATTEAEFSRQFVSMLGNLPALMASIGGGVLFAILLAALNTMLMAARERTQDLGVMKALGFGDGTVAGMLVLESLFLCTLGGLLGVGFAKFIEPMLRSGLRSFMPGFSIKWETLLLAIGLAVAIGLLAGLLPAWRARKLRAVDSLRAVV